MVPFSFFSSLHSAILPSMARVLCATMAAIMASRDTVVMAGGTQRWTEGNKFETILSGYTVKHLLHMVVYILLWLGKKDKLY